MKDTLSSLMLANITGNVFMLCREMGRCDFDSLRHYEELIISALQEKAGQGASEADLHSQLKIEIDKIRQGLDNDDIPDDDEPVRQNFAETVVEASLEKQTPLNEVDDSGESPIKRKESGYKPKHTEMQEKLQIERKPLVELVKKDCIEHGLLSAKRAKYWVHNMSGRIKEEVEADVVIEISQNLHNKVKNYIRKNKGDNPWSTPVLQNDLRNDITAVKTVRGVLLLSAQINAEVDRHESGKKPGIFKRLFKGENNVK